MVFTDFNSQADVQKKYNIRYVEAEFLSFNPVTPSETFVHEFEFSKTHFDIFSSEASRCENIIYPVLREVCKKFVTHYSLWSHAAISADSTLSGTPDYMIASRSELGINILGTPLLLIAEAKQNNFTKGWGQCLAELVASQIINESQERPVYGIVTDGETWQFGKLEQKLFTKDPKRATLDKMEMLFGALYAIVELATVSE